MLLEKSTAKTPTASAKEKAGVPQNLAAFGTEENKIIELLEKNLELAEKNLWFNERIMRWIFWQKVRSWFYLLLIIAPLIFAAVYLPPILKDFYSQYGALWNMFKGNGGGDELNMSLSGEQLQKLKGAGIVK